MERKKLIITIFVILTVIFFARWFLFSPYLTPPSVGPSTCENTGGNCVLKSAYHLGEICNGDYDRVVNNNCENESLICCLEA